MFYSLNHVSYNIALKRNILLDSPWEICQGENSLFRSLSKFPFAKHLHFLRAGHLVLPDKGFLEESLRRCILNF